MSFVAIGLFVLACGWNVYRLFLPTRAAALRNEGHPQYFGAALAAGYIAFLAIFLHATAIQSTWYPVALGTLVKLAPHVDQKDQDKEPLPKPETPAHLRLHIGSLTVAPGAIIGEKAAQLPAPANALAPPSKERKKKDPYPTVVAVAIWSALLALLLPFALNAPFRRNARLRLLAGRKSFNDVEEALVDALERGASVAITLTTGKVYIGLPNEFDPNGAEADWVSIWPLASGYRTRKGKLALTTAYQDAYQKIDGDEGIPLSSDDFKITLPLGHIVSIQSFKLKFYIEHFAKLADDGQDDLSAALEDAERSEAAENEEEGQEHSYEADRNPWPKHVPDNWLRTLKWGFHIAFTAIIVSAPFNAALCLFSILLAAFCIVLLRDPTDAELDILLAAMKDA